MTESDAGPPPRAFAIVIGTMKGGTTSLFHHLSGHREINPCTLKEPDFYRADVFEKGWSWYEGLWSPMDPLHRWALESSTSYTKRPRALGVPRRMAETGEERDLELRFLYVLRDPLDRIESHMTHALAGGDRDGHHLSGIRKGSLEGHVLEVTMYAAQLDAYLEHFDRSQIHLVCFEDLVADPEATLQEVFAFLDVAPVELGTLERRNASVGKYEKGRVWDWLERSHLINATSIIPESVKDPLRHALGQEIEQRVVLTAEQERFIREALAADLERLEDEYGFDTSPWRIGPSATEPVEHQPRPSEPLAA